MTVAGKQTLFGFDAPPPHTLSHRADPDTSREAASNTSLLNKQRQEALAILRKHGPGTACEIASRSGADRFMLSRRLGELRDAGFARQVETRNCAVKGTKQIVWDATERGKSSS
jgi:predicted transcriptional regulator